MSILIATQLALCLTAQTAQPETKTEFKRKTVIEFSDVEISGQLVRPEGSLIHSRRTARFKSLIRLRGDFRPELFKSLDAL